MSSVPPRRTGAEPIVRRVVVVGGGISGLAAAWELSGEAQGHGGRVQVTVVESSPRLGGALDSQEFGGRRVDTGPDGFLGRRPEAADLCRQIGLGDALIPVAGGGAGVWARGRVRPLPQGLALGIPTRFWPAARSGVLGVRGQLGLARDVLLPRPDVRGPIGDRSIGPLVARKLGQRVVDRLVDPLIGGIHAGSVDDMSAAAVYPPLLTAARRRGSLMRALRAELPAPQDDPPPLFWALEDGMASMVEQLRTVLLARGVEIRCGTAAEGLERQGGGWTVVTGGARLDADALVLALPAPAAGRLLRPHDDEAAGLLDGISYAPVTLVTVRVRSDAVASTLIGTGFLVPRRSPVPHGNDAWAVTACTYLSQKWPHLASGGDRLLRASLGRFGDDRAESWSDAEVVDRVVTELGALIGLSGEPMETLVTRWPRAFPQYRVHHLMRTAGIEAAVARLGGLAVAGAAYRGVGIPACIASGRAAAQAVG
jgi:protoporphyrinogen/coproporphyrinogen III oxidase